MRARAKGQNREPGLQENPVRDFTGRQTLYCPPFRKYPRQMGVFLCRLKMKKLKALYAGRLLPIQNNSKLRNNDSAIKARHFAPSFRLGGSAFPKKHPFVSRFCKSRVSRFPNIGKQGKCFFGIFFGYQFYY